MTTPASNLKSGPGKQAAALPADTIVRGDCITTMNAWPEDSVDLVFADPPYNIGFEYDGHYVDEKSDDDYLDWTCDWINAATRLLKPSGSMYILIGDEYAAETRVHLKQLQRDGKLLFRNWIVWHYTFGQRCKIKFNRSHAHLFYCVGSAALTKMRGPRKANRTADYDPSQAAYKPRPNLSKDPPFTFHYDQAAIPSARMTTYNDARTNPKGKLPDDTWYLKQFPGAADWHWRPQDAIEEGSDENGRAYLGETGDTWYQSRLAGTFKEREQWHPCQLPEALLDRIVNVSSNPGDLVFDPFAGSGTTLAVAKRLGRRYLGCELSPDYREKALERLDAVGKEPAESKPVITKRGKRAGRANRKAVGQTAG